MAPEEYPSSHHRRAFPANLTLSHRFRFKLIGSSCQDKIPEFSNLSKSIAFSELLTTFYSLLASQLVQLNLQLLRLPFIELR